MSSGYFDDIEEEQVLNEQLKRLRQQYVDNTGDTPPPPPPEPDAERKERDAIQRRMDSLFDEYIEMERKKGELTDERWNSICDALSMRLGHDFSARKITADTKMYRDAKIRADSIKQEIATETPKPHQLQRLYFSAFSPQALQVMIENKLRPKSCAFYSLLCLQCDKASGIARISKYDILEKLDLSHKNAPSYFNELTDTGLVVDKSNHRRRKDISCFYLPHTHQNAKDIAKNQERTDALGGGDWVLMTPEAVEILTNEKKIHGTHWYLYAYLCLNAYRETGLTMKTLPKPSVIKTLNPCASKKTIYRVFETLEALDLILPERHKKDVYFLPHIVRKFAELAVKNGG